jgi:SAM-dependent methyltransferase
VSNDPTSAVTRTPQNIYDDATFFEGYKLLRDGDTGLNGALEIPALHRLLPNLSNLHVLDLGCGFGEFARFARTQGAASVTGVDISRRMLEEATQRTSDASVTYLRSPIEQYAPTPRSLDLVVSSLALHYVEDYAGLVERVFQGLKPGGRFLFSVEHPVCTAYPAGWARDAEGRKRHWPLDHYRQEGERDTRWFVDGVIKYHRTVETYVNTLIWSGFLLEHLGEPAPTTEVLKVRPTLEDDSVSAGLAAYELSLLLLGRMPRATGPDVEKPLNSPARPTASSVGPAPSIRPATPRRCQCRARLRSRAGTRRSLPPRFHARCPK